MADAHSFTWHGTGQSLLEAKLTAIAAARSSVVMETFIFRDSDIGARFRDALTAAAQRRVCVRLIVDAVGSFGLGRDYFDELMAAGGAMRWFNELRLASFSFRDHRKLLVVDDTQAFVGGCNIAPEYGGDGITAGWRDGGVSVRGPVAAVLAAEFDRQWERHPGSTGPFLTVACASALRHALVGATETASRVLVFARAGTWNFGSRSSCRGLAASARTGSCSV